MLHGPNQSGHHFLRDAIADADRRRAASPRIVDLTGSHVAAAELFYDGPVPADIRRQAEGMDRKHAAECADPLARAQDALRDAELERNVALLGLSQLAPFLREQASTPDDAYIGRPHDAGCCSTRMATVREEAQEYRERVIAAVVQITALNLAIGRIVREAA